MIRGYYFALFISHLISTRDTYLYYNLLINFQLYSINSGAADCATGASIIYKSLLKDTRMSRYCIRITQKHMIGDTQVTTSEGTT